MDLSNNESIYNFVLKARERINGHVWTTPLEFSDSLARETGANVYLKYESEQISGTMKARGAFNKVLKASEGRRNQEGCMKKFFAASAGNHGMAMMYALKSRPEKCAVYVPTTTPQDRIDRLLLHGAEIHKEGDDMAVTMTLAKQAAERESGIFVSPCGDPDVIAGQGTIAFEILQDLPNVDAIFVQVGGGGMISGISSYAKHVNPKIQIIGCAPINSNGMEESIKAGKPINIEIKHSLSAPGNIGLDSITFPICQRNVDRWVNVTEDEIADAMYLMVDVHYKVVEGAAGCALASFLKVKDDFKGQNIAIVICGSNVSPDILKKIIDKNL
uniref:putative threonine dehydratase isoform X2 n=1 Tax=Styela clava TaxID=7725 RepID=UPI00193A32B2|nr:putative threonine dehydratase isoform X2 [Styela clava]